MTAVAILFASVIWYQAFRSVDPIQGLATWWLNTLAIQGPKAPLRDDLALVGVDLQSLTLEALWPEDIEASEPLQKIKNAPPGGWPWPRDVHAAAIRKLLEAGARAVFVDFVFSSAAEGDDALRELIAEYPGRIFLGATVEEREVRNVGRTAKITGPPASILPGEERFLSAIAVVNFFPGATDGIIRGFLPAVRTSRDGQLTYPTFSGRALQVRGVPFPDPLPRFSLPMLFTQRPGARQGPNRAFQPMPVYELFVEPLYQQNFVNTGAVKDKLVVYGPSAPTFQDFHPTPFGSMLGAELHLQAMNAALQNAILYEVPATIILASPWVAALLVLLLCRFLPHALFRLFVIAGIGGLFWLGASLLYAHAGWVINIMPALAAVLLTGISTFVVEIVVERLERARTQSFLERYVSKDVAKYLLENPEEFLSTQRKAVTCLFSDVRGFTTLTEQGDPDLLVEQLNEYLSEMVTLVHRHKGTLDKFIGDAVMAVWGHPYSQSVATDARNAVACALEMNARLRELNPGWAARGMNEWRIGIGVNSGEKVIVGNMGSEEKMELTVIGDAINLAARLESATKQYGADFLIGEETAFLLGDEFVLRPVDVIKVKGKDQPVEVHTVLGRREELGDETMTFLDQYRNALRDFKMMDFASAQAAFQQLSATHPDDYLCKMYAERSAAYLIEPPPDDWDGVTTMTSK